MWSASSPADSGINSAHWGHRCGDLGGHGAPLGSLWPGVGVACPEHGCLFLQGWNPSSGQEVSERPGVFSPGMLTGVGGGPAGCDSGRPGNTAQASLCGLWRPQTGFVWFLLLLNDAPEPGVTGTSRPFLVEALVRSVTGQKGSQWT